MGTCGNRRTLDRKELLTIFTLEIAKGGKKILYQVFIRITK